jgi:hypothetical protein
VQPLATSANEVSDLIEWLRRELDNTQYGKVGLVFTLHQGEITGIERTTSIHGKFTLKIAEEG